MGTVRARSFTGAGLRDLLLTGRGTFPAYDCAARGLALEDKTDARGIALIDDEESLVGLIVARALPMAVEPNTLLRVWCWQVCALEIFDPLRQRVGHGKFLLDLLSFDLAAFEASPNYRLDIVVDPALGTRIDSLAARSGYGFAPDGPRALTDPDAGHFASALLAGLHGTTVVTSGSGGQATIDVSIYNSFSPSRLSLMQGPAGAMSASA